MADSMVVVVITVANSVAVDNMAVDSMVVVSKAENMVDLTAATVDTVDRMCTEVVTVRAMDKDSDRAMDRAMDTVTRLMAIERPEANCLRIKYM